MHRTGGPGELAQRHWAVTDPAIMINDYNAKGGAREGRGVLVGWGRARVAIKKIPARSDTI